MEENINITNINDEALLESFFAEARTDVTDDGFVERVMAALPERQTSFATLRRWSRLADIIGAIVLVVGAALIFGNFLTTLNFEGFNFSPSAVLVNFMLFIHRLPEHFTAPNAQQLVSIAVAAVVLMTLFIQQFATIIRKQLQ